MLNENCSTQHGRHLFPISSQLERQRHQTAIYQFPSSDNAEVCKPQPPPPVQATGHPLDEAGKSDPASWNPRSRLTKIIDRQSVFDSRNRHWNVLKPPPFTDAWRWRDWRARHLTDWRVINARFRIDWFQPAAILPSPWRGNSQVLFPVLVQTDTALAQTLEFQQVSTFFSYTFFSFLMFAHLLIDSVGPTLLSHSGRLIPPTAAICIPTRPSGPPVKRFRSSILPFWMLLGK